MTESNDIAIIGAGLSGLILAQQLAATHQVQVFEKSRGLGGRLATRYAEPYQFDHGVHSFKAKSTAFQAYLYPLQQAGLIVPWNADTVEIQADKTIIASTDTQPDYVGVPKMNQIGKYLAEGMSIERQTRITAIQGTAGAWMLQTDTGAEHGPYDWVISTAPPEQSAAILPPGCLPEVQDVPMDGCYVMMLGFADPLPIEWELAHVQHDAIHRIILNHTKPGRPAGYSMVVHSTKAWAETYSAAKNDWVLQQLVDMASDVVQHDLSQAVHTDIHQWRYATSEKPLIPINNIDTQNQIAVCGDWCQQGDVESAYQMAIRVAGDILRALNLRPVDTEIR